MESQFFDLPRETKIVSKNWIVREIGVKIVAFDSGEGDDFWFELSGGLKNMRVRQIGIPLYLLAINVIFFSGQIDGIHFKSS